MAATTDHLRGSVPLVGLLVILACGTPGAPPRHPLTSDLEDPPPDILLACQLAEKRCRQCHGLDRVVRADIGSPDHWRRYVSRMRRKPGSEITHDDEPEIVRCLVYRRFGEPGLEHLDSEGPIR